LPSAKAPLFSVNFLPSYSCGCSDIAYWHCHYCETDGSPEDSKLNEAGKQIVSIRYGGFNGPATNQQFLVLKNQILADPEIENMTLANHLPRLDFFGPINMEMQFPEINEEKHPWFQLNGDYDFPKTFNLKIIAGRDFDPKI